MITGCLRPTPLSKLHELSGIASPAVRREIASGKEKIKASIDPLHPLYGHNELSEYRLKSRRSFMRNVIPVDRTGGETLPSGNCLDYGRWKTLNRIRSGVARCKYNLCKWKLAESDLCECGMMQNDKPLLECALSGGCDEGRLTGEVDASIEKFVKYWENKGI